MESTYFTPRLVLQRVVPADATDIFEAYAHDPRVAKYMRWKPHQSVADSEAFVKMLEKEKKRKGGHQAWAIRLRETSQLIGLVGLDVFPPKVHLGYVLGHPWWGNGYVSEAVKTMIDAAFQLPAVFRVEGICEASHEASGRVMTKGGMSYEGLLRSHTVLPNISEAPSDMRMYAIVRDDWETLKKGDMKVSTNPSPARST
ncbi:GNAT family N-acetyltransferase [Pontibacter sp. G13]|uniref:GNAT family N-acetyltransferase n=1 Tax=Pontibacter sp. G13 TaxID=3074898 RepID=UPI00288BD274|nr:GNAT family N-acetyltransferase [Pontibacter sp. G13]WNJ20684.1 GNAT family N-acetyltransferase [Pontibacter sp. G13]